jgi:hypothetical protein
VLAYGGHTVQFVVSPANTWVYRLTCHIQVLRASTVASMHRNLGRQLVDGHWVLSFPDAEAAETARNLVDQHQVGQGAHVGPCCHDSIIHWRWTLALTRSVFGRAPLPVAVLQAKLRASYCDALAPLLMPDDEPQT